jgi:hypothetical protein
MAWLAPFVFPLILFDRIAQQLLSGGRVRRIWASLDSSRAVPETIKVAWEADYKGNQLLSHFYFQLDPLDRHRRSEWPGV